MIYLVSKQEHLFKSTLYTRLSEEESVKLVESFDKIQLDTETLGKDAHLVPILTLQMGNDAKDARIVVDATTIDITIYKHALESKLCIGHNLKFDIQFLFKHRIILLKVFDTMIIEQLLHLGYDNKFFRYNLHDVANRYLGIELDKSVRGEIIWRGLDDRTITYAANDVVYLEKLMELEIEACKKANCINGMNLENAFVPVISYLEWCGIRLDVEKWRIKMKRDLEAEQDAINCLNEWLLNKLKYDQYYNKYLDAQLDLFDPKPKITLNWKSNKQLIPLFQHIGFNTKTQDKKTGEIKDSISDKVIAKQKGIDDEFLRLFYGAGSPEDDDFYMGFQGASKVVSTYGQTYLDAINPYTNRIHTNFKQLGAASGRMACGNKQGKNLDLSKIKHCDAGYPQLQNLPADEITRGAFVPNPGNLMTSCDYSALESRLGADIYNEPEMINEYLHGSGDIHWLTAKICLPQELKDIDVKDIKKLRPDLRKKAKGPEFACQFGGGAKAIANTLGIPYKEAKQIEEAYKSGFKGITAFKSKGSKLVTTNGYVLMNPITGHKVYWEDHAKWKERQELSPIDFELLSKEEKEEHSKAKAYWERMALNSVTQGTGIIILKYAMIHFFKWIIEQKLFEKVLICNLVHDELSLVVGKVC